MIRTIDLTASPLWTALNIPSPGKQSGTLDLVWSDNANPLPRRLRPRQEPTTCGDYLIWRFGKAFAYRAS